MALPTTAASANFQTAVTCSGRLTPNPSAIGSVVAADARHERRR
jgi:hypothetical protein